MIQRAILLRDRIEVRTAIATVNRIIELSRQGSDDIVLCIDCAGGEVKAGFAIYEAMQLSCCAIATLCLGTAGSMAALLLAAGTARKRYSVPNARISVHDPIVLVGASRENEPLDLMIGLKNTLDAIMLRHCGHSWHELQEAQGKARSLSAAAASELGLIDEMLTMPASLAIPDTSRRWAD
jgi:ATP-dependent Clp protease, protease subunit